MRKCRICLVWGVWEQYARDRHHHFAEASQSSGIQLDNDCLNFAGNVKPTINESLREKLKNLFLPHVSVPLMLPQENAAQFHEFRVQLEPGQFGEAYHVLICSLLLRQASPRIKMHIGLKNSDQNTSAIRDLFSWYRIPLSGDGQGEGTHDGKKQATRVIAAAFRASNEKANIVSLFLNPLATQLGQDALFNHVRDSLDPLEPHTIKIRRGDESIFTSELPLARYFQPSYAAKYWLNRYFRLTGQFGESTPLRPEPPGDWPTHPNSGMIKPDSVRRLAVIHVRRSAASDVGRLMDKENLEHVAQSIAEANRLCRTSSNPQSSPRFATMAFSHVILYGDFDYRKGCELKTLVKNKLAEDKKREPDIHVSFICRPWRAASTKVDKMDQDVDELWEQFRNFNVDHIPTQVKILGIWTALRERYEDRMCVIGHRSGFVESAGLLGIPAFYLNNERDNIQRSGKLESGELLWNAYAVPNPEHDRLRELADVVNTFIPVEALGAKPTKEKQGSVFRVKEDFEKELTAALFMYMCCSLDPWKPAWTARVKMMHRGEDSSKYSTAGQGWLRERCHFAFKTANFGYGRKNR